jgi:hypothetical protein
MGAFVMVACAVSFSFKTACRDYRINTENPARTVVMVELDPLSVSAGEGPDLSHSAMFEKFWV